MFGRNYFSRSSAVEIEDAEDELPYVEIENAPLVGFGDTTIPDSKLDSSSEIVKIATHEDVSEQPFAPVTLTA